MAASPVWDAISEWQHALRINSSTKSRHKLTNLMSNE